MSEEFAAVLLERLQDALGGAQCPVVGCVRQHTLSTSTEPSWRLLRGNALLAQLGQRLEVEHVCGTFTVWMAVDEDGRPWLLQFRGGRRQDWWAEDCKLVMALTMDRSDLALGGTALIQELDSRLTIEYIGPPSTDEVTVLVQEALARWKSQARFDKRSTRARVTCPHCPVKTECDLLDLERNETSDWPDVVLPWERPASR